MSQVFFWVIVSVTLMVVAQEDGPEFIAPIESYPVFFGPPIKQYDSAALIAAANTINPPFLKSIPERLVHISKLKISDTSDKVKSSLVIPELYESIHLFDTPIYGIYNPPENITKKTRNPSPKKNELITNALESKISGSILPNNVISTLRPNEVVVTPLRQDNKILQPLPVLKSRALFNPQVNSGPSTPSTVVVKSVTPSTIENVKQEAHDDHPKYSFSYNVNNESNGDVKSHSESRNGDLVTGEYSMLEPDGFTRKVTYEADGKGFRVKVTRIPPKM